MNSPIKSSVEEQNLSNTTQSPVVCASSCCTDRVPLHSDRPQSVLRMESMEKELLNCFSSLLLAASRALTVEGGVLTVEGGVLTVDTVLAVEVNSGNRSRMPSK